MRRTILSLSLLSLVEFILVHLLVLQRFPNSGDEQAYLFQARLFARGQLWLEDPIYDRGNPLNQFVRADALDDVGGRRFPKYDPGWAAILALGSGLGAEWLVAPLLGTLTVFLLLSHVRKRIGDQFVWPTWWLLTLCSFFLCSVANYGNHTAAMACIFGAFVLYDNMFGERGENFSHGRLLLAGLLLGYCSLIRYLDWIPLMTWIGLDLLRRRQIKGLAVVLLGFGLLASFHLLYNKIMTGSALLPPALHDARGSAQARIGISWGGFEITAIRLLRVLYTFPPVLLLVLCLVRRCQSKRLKMYVGLFALNVAIYFLYAWTPAGPGPRYYFPYLPFLFLAVVEVLRLNRDQKMGQIGWRLAMVCLVLCSIGYAAVQAFDIYRRRDLERAIANLPGKKRIILLQTGTYKMGIPDLIRNPLDLWTADTVYLDYGDGVGIANLLARFPEHHVYSYRYPGSLAPWEGGKRP